MGLIDDAWPKLQLLPREQFCADFLEGFLASVYMYIYYMYINIYIYIHIIYIYILNRERERERISQVTNRCTIVRWCFLGQIEVHVRLVRARN
jgi:hypothetical protein